MSQYKVPQDVEAEDKLLGPLTLKQFIFAIVTILLGYIAFLVGRANLLLMIPFIPPMALFGFLAAPFTRDQPTDVYLGARLRFLFKPRRRIWDQTGMEELVRITVPKKIEHQYTNNLDQSEVRSRLEILASTIDSRGWATKNAYVNEPGADFMQQETYSDRLIGVSQLPANVPDTDITPADDMLDPSGNQVAYHMDQLATQATDTVRQQALAQMQAIQANPQAYTPQPATPTPQVIGPQMNTQPPVHQQFPTHVPSNANVAMPQSPSAETPNEGMLSANGSTPHYNPYPSAMRQHVINPSGSSRPQDGATKNAPEAPKATTVSLPESAKIELAQRDDLSVETIAREADRVASGDDEVVINLH